MRGHVLDYRVGVTRMTVELAVWAGGLPECGGVGVEYVDPGRGVSGGRYAPIPSCPEIGVGGLGGAGALMARRPGGVRRSGSAAPPAG
jgi:hypothetical protein